MQLKVSVLRNIWNPCKTQLGDGGWYSVFACNLSYARPQLWKNMENQPPADYMMGPKLVGRCWNQRLTENNHKVVWMSGCATVVRAMTRAAWWCFLQKMLLCWGCSDVSGLGRSIGIYRFSHHVLLWHIEMWQTNLSWGFEVSWPFWLSFPCRWKQCNASSRGKRHVHFTLVFLHMFLRHNFKSMPSSDYILYI